MSNIEDYNDPFEFSPISENASTVQSKENSFTKQYFIEHVIKNNIKFPHIQTTNDATDLFNQQTPLTTEQLSVYTRESFIKIYGQKLVVSCFSQNNNDILMWSHYANNHKGIILKFDNNKFGDHAKPIKYNKNRPVSTPRETPLENIGICYIKSDHWKYEQEVRLLLPKENKSPISSQYINGKKSYFCRLQPNTIKAIYFGLKTPKIQKQKFRDHAKDHPEIQIYQMHMHPTEYKLIPKPEES